MEQNKEASMDIYFRVWGDELDPEDITKILKIEPTETARKGDINVGKNTGTKVRAKLGKWFLKTEMYVKSNLLIEHIEFILKLLRGLKEPLYCLKTVDKLTITFVIVINENTKTVEFDLNPELLKEISEQGIELSFTII